VVGGGGVCGVRGGVVVAVGLVVDAAMCVAVVIGIDVVGVVVAVCYCTGVVGVCVVVGVALGLCLCW